MQTIPICAVFFVAGAVAQQRLPAEEFDVSNQILLPHCEVNVQFRAMRWQLRGFQQSESAWPPNYIADGTIRLNGKVLPIPGGLLVLVGDATRIKNPPSLVPCGFVVETGDASTSGLALIRIDRGRIASAERLDSAGRVLSKTTFYYPKAIVLN